ncbi:MAG TPA: alpha/beta hydrolase [Ktedonobacterales bacterium]|nr:alpha/beta hydrolase [Ktedonobacterales bacterium]
MPAVTSKDGTSIAFDQSGQGPAVILVSPAFGTRADETSLAAALAPDFTVFAYDRRGRGESGDTAPYAVEREIEDLEALLDAAGGSVCVFGHSSGAVLALDAAQVLPSKITKLALYEPPFIIDASRPPMPADFASHLTELIAAGRRSDAVEYWQTNLGIPAEAIAQMRHSPMWAELEALAPTLPYDAAIMDGTQRGDPLQLRQWASVTVPTLVMDGTVMMGREDFHTFMRHGADALASVLPNAQRRILEGQDHGPAPEALTPALKLFFLG